MFSIYDLKPRERRLLLSWEKNGSKSLLQFWALLSLADGSKSASELERQIGKLTDGAVEPQRQSLYRALRRWRDEGLIRLEPGGALKTYELTFTGQHLLQLFILRDLRPLRHPDVRRIIEQVE